MMLTTTEKERLRQIAWQSIKHGFANGHSKPAHTHVAALDRPGASFITLLKQGDLRGCIGTLEAHEPLAQNVSNNAYNAAFHDPRFAPLAEEDIQQVELQISVLSHPEPLEVNSQSDVLAQLQPGIDGVVFQDGTHKSTFLPQVWDQLPTPEAFMAQLKQKAGLPANHWSANVRILRYTVDKF